MTYRDAGFISSTNLIARFRSLLSAKQQTARDLVAAGKILCRLKKMGVFKGKGQFTMFCAREPTIRERRRGAKLLRIGRWLQVEEVVHTRLVIDGLEGLAMIRARHQEATLAPVLCHGKLRFSTHLRAIFNAARDATDSVAADEVLEAGVRELLGRTADEPRPLRAPAPTPAPSQTTPAPGSDDLTVSKLQRDIEALPEAQVQALFARLGVTRVGQGGPPRGTNTVGNDVGASEHPIDGEREEPTQRERRGVGRDATAAQDEVNAGDRDTADAGPLDDGIGDDADLDADFDDADDHDGSDDPDDHDGSDDADGFDDADGSDDDADDHDGSDDDADDHDGSDDDADDHDGSAPSPASVPAGHPLASVKRTVAVADAQGVPVRPRALSSDDLVLTVSYPDGEVQELDEADRRSAELITAFFAFSSVRTAIRGYRGRHIGADCLLQLRLVRAVKRFRAMTGPLREALAPLIERIRDDLRAENPGVTDDDLPMPVFVNSAFDDATALPEDIILAAPEPLPEIGPIPDPLTAPDSPQPLSFLLIPCPDPLGDDDPTIVERLIWRALGLLEHLHSAVPAWVAARQVHGVGTDLLYQLSLGLDRAYFGCGQLHADFSDGAIEGVAIEEETASRAADLTVAPGSERPMTVLGARALGPLSAVIGVDEDGDQVVLDLNVPHFLLSFGEKGMGKSTLIRLIAEALHLALPRLCNHDLRGRPNPFRSVSVAVHAQHRGRLEAAKGFFPNPRADHQELLRVTYGSRADNAAHRSGLLLCRPGQEQTMHARQAAACERGLQVVPLWLSPADLDLFGYEALLSVGLREDERPRALSLLPALLSANGPMTPQELLRELKRTRAHVGAIEPRLRALDDLVRPGPSLAEILRRCDGPIFLQLEGDGPGAQWLWSLALVVMNTLARSAILEADQLHLWLLIEELSQMMMNPQARAFLSVFGRETRHGRMSLCGGGQNLLNVTRSVLSLLSGLFLFRLPPGELALLRGVLRWLEGVLAAEVARLQVAQALCAFSEASDPRFRERLQLVHLRPTATWAGGETVTVL